MLRHRLPSAAALILGLLLAMAADTYLASRGWLPGTALFFGLLLPFVVLAAWELEPILRAVQRPGGRRALAIGGVLGLAVSATWAYTGHRRLHADPQLLAATIPAIPVVLGWGLMLVCRRRQSARGITAAALSLGLGFLFVGLPAGAWLGVRQLASPWFLVALLLTVKACDIGAYFTGRAVGRHKWVPWVSPGKTWEGLLGGVVFAGLIAAILHQVWGGGQGRGPLVGLPVWSVFLLGGALGFAGQVGDLFASAFKRDAGVKDYASTIPGFGGVLDVTDSLLLTGPLVLLVLHLLVDRPW